MNFEVLARFNPWWKGKENVLLDVQLQAFEKAALKWIPELFYELNANKGVLYSLRGPRQVGKTTFVKLVIKQELEKRFSENVFYFQCDLLKDFRELNSVLEEYHTFSKNVNGRKLVCLDEITSVKDWQYGYKAFVDRVGLGNYTFIVTGSSSWDLKHATELLPGRRGESTGIIGERLFLPMKFTEYISLRDPQLSKKLKELSVGFKDRQSQDFVDFINSKKIETLMLYLSDLDSLLDEYLLHGGVILAASEFVEKRQISQSTYDLYLQFFFGDIRKMGRDDLTSRRIIMNVIDNITSPVGIETLRQKLEVQNKHAILEHLDLLSNLFLFNIYSAFDINKKQERIRSQSKIQIGNPFFFHAFSSYFKSPNQSYFSKSVEYLQNSINKSKLVEALVGDYLTRLAYSYSSISIFDQKNFVFYVKNSKGESIDFLARLPNLDLPVEVKYQNDICDSDFKELKKFKKGILVTKNKYVSSQTHVAIPLSIFLLCV